MTNVIEFPRLAEKIAVEMAARAAAADIPEPSLKNLGGGGTSGGMEERVARLEKSVEKIGDQMVTVREDIATIKENMRHLPTKPWIFTTLASMVIVMIALMTFITGMMIRFLPHAS